MAKLGILKSVGHNLADSIASGSSLLAGSTWFNIWGEVSVSPERYIEIDFLTGQVTGRTTQSLTDVFEEFRQELPTLCRKHGVEISEFRQLLIRFTTPNPNKRCTTVTVENLEGRRSTDEYQGIPAARVKVLDHLGRIRRI